jgi:hypothetical protein
MLCEADCNIGSSQPGIAFGHFKGGMPKNCLQSVDITAEG